MPFCPRLLALAGLLFWRPPLLPAAPAPLAIDERYDWPDGGSLRATYRAGESLFVIRADTEGDIEGVEAGAALPWLQAGPLVGRGLLRLASDPLGCSAGSPVFEERTGLVLDESLRSSRRGAVVMPFAGLVGLFAREGPDGAGCGAFGGIPFGVGCALEGLVLDSRPPARAPPEDWYLDRSPSPGGEVTHACARLTVGNASVSVSTAAGISWSDRAAPGGFAAVRIRERAPWAEAAFLVCGVTPGYRSPDGNGTADQSLLSGKIQAGGEGCPDTLEVEWSVVTERPSQLPGLDIPSRARVRLAFSRSSLLWHELPAWLILAGEKEILRGADGVRLETARFSSAAALLHGPVEARVDLGFSGPDGARLRAEIGARAGRHVRIDWEAGADHLGTAAPTISLQAAFSVSGRRERHSLEAGLSGCPPGFTGADLSRCFRLTLATAIRVD